MDISTWSTDMSRQVIISGAGPVGCTAALLLARAGIEVTLLEEKDHLVEDLRASTFHPPSLEMLDQLGVTDTLLPQGLIASTYQYRDRVSGEYAEFDLGLLKDQTKYPFRLQCEQYKLTRAIEPLLTELPNAQLRFSTKVVSSSQSADGVSVVVETPQGQETLNGRYLIGCDGAHSVVRKQAEIELQGFTYPELFLVISTDFRFEDHMSGLAYVSYVSDPEEWCTILRVPTLWRVLFPTNSDQTEEEIRDPANIEARLQRLVPSTKPYNVPHVTLYRIHQRVAHTYRSANIMLAGDAAHLNNPLGGMGMNGGLHDAFNLCEKMIKVVNDGASEDLYDLYDRQRRQATVDFIQAQTIQNKKNIEQDGADSGLKRIAELKKMSVDKEQAVAFLRRNNMFDAVERSLAIT